MFSPVKLMDGTGWQLFLSNVTRSFCGSADEPSTYTYEPYKSSRALRVISRQVEATPYNTPVEKHGTHHTHHSSLSISDYLSLSHRPLSCFVAFEGTVDNEARNYNGTSCLLRYSIWFQCKHCKVRIEFVLDFTMAS